jgi:outer membrane protein assembly factor BamC
MSDNPPPGTLGHDLNQNSMTTAFPPRLLRPTPLRVATVTLTLLLGGCTVYGDWFGSSNSSDYKNHAQRTQPLEVPPDLTQLTRESRYLPQGGTISASELNKPGAPGAAASGAVPASGVPGTVAPVAAAPASGPAVVALESAGDLHIEHQGDQRWLVTKQSADQVWPQVRQFWIAKGFAIKEEDPQTGVMTTDWLEDKTRLPEGWLSRQLGGMFSGLFDSGLRDRYRTRLERLPEGGTGIYVTHFGALEQATGFDKSEIEWTPRPSDPNLESQMMSEMMLTLAGVVRTQGAVAVAAPAGASAPPAQNPDEYNAALIASAATLPPVGGASAKGAPRAHIVPDQPGATMLVEDNFDRTWRRVGLALDHGGFTVEDRDRAQGLYFVRFVDTKMASKEEPGIISKVEGWLGMSGPSPVSKYRISIKGNADNTSTVTVLNDQGQPDSSENPTRMVSLLVDELK